MTYQPYDWKYKKEREHRILDAAAKISARADAVKTGRLVPENADLPIGTGRRIDAAVLFVDICSFTSRPSNTAAEQEDLLRALSIFFTEMFRIVNDYDGVVEKNTGDGLMAYFADSSAAKGAERAVACAMTMMASNETLISGILETAQPFQFRIAIDYGPITVAQIGAPKLYGSIVAIGITANIANKMLRFADEDEIVIGEAVLSALPDLWQENCQIIQKSTGFVYTLTQVPYPFYLYRGRWIEPVQPMALPPPPRLLSTPPQFPSLVDMLARRKK